MKFQLALMFSYLSVFISLLLLCQFSPSIKFLCDCDSCLLESLPIDLVVGNIQMNFTDTLAHPSRYIIFIGHHISGTSLMNLNLRGSQYKGKVKALKGGQVLIHLEVLEHYTQMRCHSVSHCLRADSFPDFCFNQYVCLGNQIISDFAFLPFGGGPRKCVGDQFALMESTIALAMLLQKFDVELKGSPKDVELVTGATIHTKTGLWCKLKKRSNV